MNVDVNYEMSRDAWISERMNELEIEREFAPDAAKEEENIMANMDCRDIAEWAFDSAFEQDETYDYGRDISDSTRERMVREIENAARSSDNEETASDLAAQTAAALRGELTGTPPF